MKLKLNTLDRASKMYKAVQELDEQIIKIEKKAMELANGNFEVICKFTFRNLDSCQDKVKFDADGSLVQSGYRDWMDMIRLPYGSKPEEPKDQIEIKIDERIALSMIGTLLHIKQEERKGLVQCIKNLGFE